MAGERGVGLGGHLLGTETGSIQIVRGEVYPDLATLARLEVALRTDLLSRGLFREVLAEPERDV
ncbi:hypothetical protein [Streptomyces sp. NPDC023327]|uniref:hypothetical protein n=1 Tax=Streptomyces sp. NPDC023327 TaxID=3157088 RepID=UPI0033EAAB3A